MGETPLECLERVRKEQKIGAGVPMTYAGRLDPMAEGVLIILSGDECKNKEKYLGLDKEYEVEVLLNIKTDTQDVLGLITKIDIENVQKIGSKKEEVVDVKKYIGKFAQEYPVYSSKMIAMKEMPDEMPTKDVEIYSIEKIDEREVRGIEIAETILERISLVTGDFRQGDIGEEWYAFGEEFGNIPFKIIKLRVKCSSGTYMRSLAEKMGGLAYTIKRTEVGEYTV